MLVLVVLVLAFLALSTMNSAGQQKNVVVIHLDQEIDPGSAHMITSTLSGLTKASTAAVIIEMNTPGGLLESMLQMVTAINATEALGIPVYTYIPADGMGASAGSYVAMASDYIAMGPGSYIGPSTPIVVGGSALQQQHTEAAMQSLMVSMAQSHGRNTTAASLMVSNNTAYIAQTAYNNGLIEKLSPNISGFIQSMNLSSYNEIDVNPSFYDGFISFLSNPYVDGLFILIGAIAILFDFYHGSIILTAVGVTLIALGLIGAEAISASVVGIALLIFGAVLIFLEMKTGHGAALISGVAVGLVGTFLLASPYSSSNPGYSPSPYGSSEIVVSVIMFILAVVLALYLRKVVSAMARKKYTGAEALISKKGIVKQALDPVGWISIEGIQWKAISDDKSTIPVNEEVIVVGRDGLTLVVKEAHEIR